MSSLTVEEDLKWVPTHVQVTVLKGRGLRGKGKHGTSDVYTIIQLGKEKYWTCVVEKTTDPEWREECSFELQPGVLQEPGHSGYPAGSSELVLTVMHRALIGLDVFLGQALIRLDKMFLESRCVRNEWYRLNSKTGKKEKERGEIQLTIQFTRNNLTASMYDLVMKDKGTSTFSKLKERMKGKRKSSDEDSSSAVLPGGYGSLYRMRQRLPSDGGGEEDYEDDEGGEVRRSKMRTFFLRGKLRKSSDTRSSTSLGSESSESSSRGGSLSPTAGISVVVSDLSNSPSNSSNLTADNSPEHTANTSPKSPSLKCDFGDEAGEITIPVPPPTLCVNGSHAYQVQPLGPGLKKPADFLGVGQLQKSLPLSLSLQNLSPRASADPFKSPMGDGRRWSFDKPGEEEKAAIAAALQKSGPMQGEREERLGQAAQPKAAPTTEPESLGKKRGRNFFSHGRSESAGKGQNHSKDESEQASAAAEEKHRGWFGSKDSHSKPSLVMSPKVEPCTDPHPQFSSLVSPLHQTNPFYQAQTTAPSLSPCNPFFSLLKQNPFFEDMLTTEQLNPPLPPLPFLSTSRPPITQFFPQETNTNPTLTHANAATDDSTMDKNGKNDIIVKTGRQDQHPGCIKGDKPSNWKGSNPFRPTREPEPDPGWDESFEAFAAGRLQPPEDMTTDCKIQQNTPGDHPLEHSNYEKALPSRTDADQSTNVSDAMHPLPCTEFVFGAHRAVSLVTSTNKLHVDTYPQMLETIPEHLSFESDSVTLNASSDSLKLDACVETSRTNSTTNTNDLPSADALCHTSSTQLSSSSPDPASSGLGSSAEDDFLSCLSSYSDKFSASSCEEAGPQTPESIVKSSEEENISRPLESDIAATERPNDLSLLDLTRLVFVEQQAGNEILDSTTSRSMMSPDVTHQQPITTAGGTEAEGENAPTLNIWETLFSDPLTSDISSHCYDESRHHNNDEFSCSIIDYSKEISNSSVNDKHVMIPTSPEDVCPTNPSLFITTSSPDVRRSSSDSPFESTLLGAQDASQHSPVPFIPLAEFLSADAVQDLDSTLLHTLASDQRPSSLLQSLYVSTDSQVYQISESHLSSNYFSVLEPSTTLNSTACGNLQMSSEKAAGLEESAPSPSGQGIKTDRCKEPEDNPALGKPGSIVGHTSEDLPAAQRRSYVCRNPGLISENVLESQRVILDDEYSESPQTCAPLHRSQSEGTLAPLFDKVLLPSFGSDPGALKASSTAPPGPDLPPSSCPFPLTPEIISSPVAILFHPPLSKASVRSTSSTAPDATPKLRPQEPKQQQAANQQNSPHPVKPLTTAMLAEEKRTESRSVLASGLEKLKSTIHPGRSSQSSEQEAEKKKCLTEGAGSYYHLTHSELIALLVQREAELARQKVEFEKQKFLLAKRELELKKLKPQVRDLEDYIDTLLVRIMEQKPTLLQVRSKFK